MKLSGKRRVNSHCLVVDGLSFHFCLISVVIPLSMLVLLSLLFSAYSRKCCHFLSAPQEQKVKLNIRHHSCCYACCFIAYLHKTHSLLPAATVASHFLNLSDQTVTKNQRHPSILVSRLWKTLRYCWSTKMIIQDPSVP